MPYAHPSCQLGASRTPETRGISPHTGDTQHPTPTHKTERTIEYSDTRYALVHGADQEVERTQSRQSGPRKWLRAVEWLIAAGLHGRANATTRRIAEDLAARMDYDTGHVRYCLDETVARTGVSKASVKRHVGYLRELGALAWVQHGTRTNIRRAMGLKGYAATATIYAAVIPAVYDHAMGHRIIGAGYTARIVIDQRGQQQPQIPAQTRREPVDNPPVENPGLEGLEPPSLTWLREESQVQMVGGVTTTAERSQQTRPTKTRSGKKRTTILGSTVTAAGMQLGDKLAKAIRRRVPWTRRASHDQMRWVCADMGEQQWTEDQAVRFAVEAGHAHRAGFGWDPSQPHRLIAMELQARRAQQQDDQAMQDALTQAVAWEDSTAYRNLQSLRTLFGTPDQPEQEPKRTDEDRMRARMNWNNWPDVLDHFEEDELDAIDLYGKKLVDFAIEQGARTRRNDHAYL
ncbi:hypothetical protein [Streptomyces rochei]|uniref:hypothetical protein n=1 Tax=Streptomyces rochei TaxID=1928 RepID=UPI004064B09E